MRTPIYEIALKRNGSLVSESMPLVDSSDRAVDLFREFIGDSAVEVFAMAAVDARRKVIGISQVSVGTLSASLVHPREVFKVAIMLNAAGVIVSHNHPSGDPAPSSEDRDATRRLQRAGELMGIPLLDHVIIGAPGQSFSFRQSGLL